jgi:hypothetical protein
MTELEWQYARSRPWVYKACYYCNHLKEKGFSLVCERYKETKVVRVGKGYCNCPFYNPSPKALTIEILTWEYYGIKII